MKFEDNEFRHFEYSKRSSTNCVKCLKIIQKGDMVKAIVVDDVLRTNSLYCGAGTFHIDNPSDYREYLIKQFNITDVVVLNKKVHEWELYRIKKGYLSIPEVKRITKAHKEAYQDYLQYQRSKKLNQAKKLRMKQKDEMTKLFAEITDITMEMERE